MKEDLEVINVGIFGHIDHGKTTLLYRLTGKWADEHSEELKRGITIKLGYADVIVKKKSDGKITLNINEEGKPIRQITFVDAPGHEMLMATMLSGAAIVDAAILVIAANEGIKPQTREHFLALEAKKVPYLIIAQNKIDLVSEEQAMKNYNEIKEFIKGTSYENSPIIPLSAQQNINLDVLIEEICKIKIKEKLKEEDPIFFVARSFDINKPGTPLKKLHGGVLGGALKKGVLRVGDTIEIKPGRLVKKQNKNFYETINTKIVSIMRGNLSLKEASPGGSLSLETTLDPILTKSDSLVGRTISIKGKLPEISEVIFIKPILFKEIYEAEEKIIPEKIKIGEILMLNIDCLTTVGTVNQIKEDTLSIQLKIPVVPLKGETIGIARNIKGHWRLIGYGELKEDF